MGTLHSYLLDHVLHDESAVHVKALDLFWHITLQRLRGGCGGGLAYKKLAYDIINKTRHHCYLE